MLKMIFIFVVGSMILSFCSERHPASAKYNVYFYFPADSKEYYLGVTQGLDQCGQTAWNFAREKGLKNNNDWSYICCLKTSTSECESKHR